MTANEDMARAVAGAMRPDGTLRPDRTKTARAAENRQYVRDLFEKRDPALARVISAFLGARPEREPRTTRGRTSR